MLKGIYTPLLTFFDEKGRIDHKNTGILIEKLVKDGVNGIVLLGSIGEFFNLTTEEKKEYIKAASAAINGRTQLIVGTGSNNINEVIELNQIAKDAHADAVLVITPYFFGLGENYIYEYYSAIARNTELPVILYNFPARTSVNISPELVYRLATEYKNIAGIKDTTDSISNVRKFIKKIKAVRKDFSVISGFDEYLLPNLLSGGDGIIGGLTNINAPLFLKAFQAFQNKDFDLLVSLQDKINKLTGLYDLTNPFIIAMKEAVRIELGLDINTSLRNYNFTLDEKVREEIRKLIQE